MNKEYSARRSAIADFKIGKFLLLILLGVIPGIVYLISKIIIANNDKVIFYDKSYVKKSGVFNIKEEQCSFVGVLYVSFKQTFKERIFNYGTVFVDVVGQHDLTLTGIKNPKKLVKYLNTRTIDSKNINHIVTN